MDRKLIKKCAKESLRGNLGKSICVCLIFLLLPLIQSMLQLLSIESGVMAFNFLSVIISIFVIIPMSVGITKFFLELSRNNNPEVGIIFKGFDNIGKNIGTVMLAALLLIPVGIIYGISLGIVASSGAVVALASGESLTTEAIIAIAILSALYMIFLIIYSYMISQITYILADGTDKSCMGVIRYSWGMMKGYKWKLFLFELSFAPWAFLCVITCGLASFYVLPYMSVAYANFYKAVKEEYDKNQLEFKSHKKNIV